jgi:hypothetical protein
VCLPVSVKGLEMSCRPGTTAETSTRFEIDKELEAAFDAASPGAGTDSNEANNAALTYLLSVWRRKSLKNQDDPHRFAHGVYYNTTGIDIAGTIRQRRRSPATHVSTHVANSIPTIHLV